MSYRPFFGLTREPFSADLETSAILQTDELLAIGQRVEYVIRIGGIALVTGEVGAGKSTSLRWAAGQLHPSRYKTLWITATAGSILEVYRQLLAELDINTVSSSRAVLTRLIRQQIQALVSTKKQQPLLIIDEASLLRLDVFAELHTLTQFEGDSKPWLPRHPCRTEQSRRQPPLSHRHPSGLTRRGQGAPQGGQQGAHGTLHQPSPRPRRPEKLPVRRAGPHRCPSGLRRTVSQGQSPRQRGAHRRGGGKIPACHRRSCQNRGLGITLTQGDIYES